MQMCLGPYMFILCVFTMETGLKRQEYPCPQLLESPSIISDQSE